MDRRTFIKSSTALSGGLLVGISAFDGSIVAAAESEFSNAWVKISADNSVTIYNARSEMGQDVYTTMPMLIAEELEYPLQKIKVEFAPANSKFYINELLGGQITGGSTSVREAWTKLRTVGATAREMLISAAAAKWNVPASQCQAINGTVISGSNRATYGELAALAAQQKAPEKPTLKSKTDFKIIGKEFPRLDTVAKVNSTAKYGVDVRQPNMVAASLAQCPVIGGKVKSVNSTAAKAVKGVIDIVTVTDGVAVLAKDFYTAKKARDLLEIQWDTGSLIPPLANMKTIEDGFREASKKAGAIISKVGDFENPTSHGTKTVKAEYLLPYLAHSTLEPVNCSASVANGECHVWGPIQFQEGSLGAAIAASGLPAEKVFIHTTFIGGGYGRKLEYDFVTQAVEISKAAKRPVRLIWSREDDMTHDFYRPMSLHQMSGALDAHGKLVGLSTKMTSSSVTARAFPPFVVNGNDPFMTEGSANLTYNIPNLRVENVIHESGLRVGYWRAVSNNLNAFATESFIDELALSAKKDPVAFRMDMLDKHPRAQKVLKTAAEKAGWGHKRSNGRFLGVAQMECYDAYGTLIAEVSVKNGAPVVHKLTYVVDCGLAIRPDQIRAQLTSAILLGYSSAMKNQITLKNGAIEQSNFNNYTLLRMSEAPQIDITIIEGGEKPSGMGEVGVPLVAPAIANAFAAATGGKRVRKLPFIA